jgi:basic membrane protein A
MKVQFVGSWSDATLEANAAQALIDQGCVLISQHSDNTTPATTAEKNGVFHTGYNADMIDAAPKASIISTRIDWTKYFVYAISAVAEGKNFDADYSHGMAEGEVVMTDLNEEIAAPGTAEKMKEVMDQIAAGTLKVFDTSKFTVEGKTLDSYMADVDSDDAFTPDTEVVKDGYFHESESRSAPYFDLTIDGITLLDTNFG